MEEEQALWLVRAETAVGAGRDDLARQALFQKKSLEEEISKGKELRHQTLTELEILEQEWQECQLNYTKTNNKLLLFKHQQTSALHTLNNEGLGNSRALESEFAKYHQEQENEAEISALKTKLNNKHKEK
jgi:phage shock protein A